MNYSYAYDSWEINQNHSLKSRAFDSHGDDIVGDRATVPDGVEHSDLDLPPQVRKVRLLREVKLPRGVLELRDVVGTLAQRDLDGGPGHHLSGSARENSSLRDHLEDGCLPSRLVTDDDDPAGP